MAMASPQLLAVCFILLCTITFTLSGQYHMVGDSGGWTVGTTNYTSWSASKSFQVGDNIRKNTAHISHLLSAVFQYNNKFHNVVQVTRSSCHSCNTSSPLAVHSTGNDTFLVNSRGHYFFICGFPGHCEGGQKVDIRVTHDLAPPPSLPPSTLPTPAAGNSDSTTAIAKARAPSSGHASALLTTRIHWVAGLACCLSTLFIGSPISYV
ncbi:Mavicyanin [Nymphaea thermarum]|nr:Mavicyanin [Nymphaea thermarum]